MTIQQLQNDDLVMSVATALAVANDVATAEGVEPRRSLVTITEESEGPGSAWRIEYGARDFIHRRGADLIVLVDKVSGEVQRVQHGQ